MSVLPVDVIKAIVWGDGAFETLDKSDPDKPDENPFPEIILKNQVAAAVTSSGGATVAFDWALPPVDDTDSEENSPFWKAPVVLRYAPDALKKTSGRKFTELLALIRKVFDGHDEEMNEAIETVTKIRDDERNAMLAQIAAAQ